jgi:regulator of sigma E protease
MLGVIVGIVSFMFAILVHELGHYLAAVKSGIPVKTFSIGFPLPFPVIRFARTQGGASFELDFAALSWRIGTIAGTGFYLAPVPFGGYVQFEMEGQKTIENAPASQRLLVMIGGVVFNFVFGYIALVVRALAQGNELGYALTVALINLGKAVVGIPVLLFGALASGGFEVFSGPIGIVTMIGSSTGDMVLFWSIFALLNISLGVMNLIPIGPLDGTKILIILIEKLIRRELPARLKNGYMVAGLVVILAILVIATWGDIGRILN